MAAHGRWQVPDDLRRAQNRFQDWRRSRPTPGGRIPLSLWSLAVRLARTYGISRTATALGLHHHRLKIQVEAATRSQPVEAATRSLPPAPTPAFVELPASVGLGKQCSFELDNGTGTTMRVQLTGYDAADVAVLARNFWSAT